MKRMIRIFAAIVLASVMLGGCASPGKMLADYELYDVWDYGNGTYSLRLQQHLWKKAGQGGVAGENISFKTVEEMYTTILEGRLSESQLSNMHKKLPKLAEGEIKLFDIRNVYDIVLPERGRLESISFYGEEYIFGFEAGFFSGSLRVSTKERYESFKEKNDPEKSTMKLLWTEEDSATNGRIYYLENSVNVVKHTVFSVSGEYGNYTVCQKETVTGYDANAYAYFWGEYNGTYITGTIRTLIERVTPEWFQNFGVKPFAESKTE